MPVPEYGRLRYKLIKTMTGTVKWIKKGYFFIAGIDGKEYFSVFRNIKRDKNGCRPWVHIASALSFDTKDGTGKLRVAVNVEVLEE